MKKDLEYYLQLEYKIELSPFPKEEGGGYEATIPQLGRYAFVGRGKTQAEALKKLKEIKEHYFQNYLAKKLIIPEPEKEEEYSGKFLLRLPKRLHKELVVQASENEVSLNQYIVYLLSSNIQIESLRKKIEELSERMDRNTQTTILIAEGQSSGESTLQRTEDNANLGLEEPRKTEPNLEDKLDSYESEIAH